MKAIPWLVVGAVAYFYLVKRTERAAQARVDDRIDSAIGEIKDKAGGLGEQVSSWINSSLNSWRW